MEIDPSLPDLYRYQLRNYLQEKAKETPSDDSPKMLFADLVQLSAQKGFIPPAPQDLGEAKHGVVDTPPVETPPNQPDLPQIEQRDDRWTSDSSLIQFAAPAAEATIELRRTMEKRVRVTKKSRMPCPYCSEENLCIAPYIRCGDRLQYGAPETAQQRSLPHQCLYEPGNRDGIVLIVDKERAVREFCMNALEIFFGIAPARLIAVGSVHQAIDQLKNAKIAGKRCSLCIVGADLPDRSGFELVNDLFNRNHDVDVLLLQDQGNPALKPAAYCGDEEIIANHPLVRKTLSKPFHSTEFVETIQELDRS